MQQIQRERLAGNLWPVRCRRRLPPFHSWAAKACARYSLLLCLPLILLVGCAGRGRTTPPDDRVEAILARTSNQMVHWDGGPFGLRPEFTGNMARQLKRLDKAAIPVLVSAMADRDRYVVAHILLTWLSGDWYTTGPPRWNGLHVDLRADGAVVYDPADQAILREKWQWWLVDQRTRGKADLPTLLAAARWPGISRDIGLEFLCKHPAFSEMVRQREDRMQKLQQLLAEAKENTRIQCLTIDTMYEGTPGPCTWNSLLLHRVDPPSAPHEQRLRDLGSIGLSEKEWQVLKPYVEKVVTLRQPRKELGIGTGPIDVAVVCHYDGKQWNSRVWLQMDHVLMFDDYTGAREFASVMNLVDWFSRVKLGKELRDSRYSYMLELDVVDELEE